MPTVLNAANEAAVKLFLARKIKYKNIYEIVKNSLEKEKQIENPSLEIILQTNKRIFCEILQNTL